MRIPSGANSPSLAAFRLLSFVSQADVAPDTDGTMLVSESQLTETGLLGSYRKAIGWGAGRTSQAGQDQSFHLLKPLTPTRVQS